MAAERLRIACVQSNIPALHGYKTGDSRFEFLDPSLCPASQSWHARAYFNRAALWDEVRSWPHERRIAVLVESPIDVCFSQLSKIERRFPLILTHRRDLIERGSPYAPLWFGSNWLSVDGPVETAKCLETRLEKSKLVSFMGSIVHPDVDAYRFRRKVAERVLGRSDVDCFGKGIREVASKREALESYCFSIVMENAAQDFYFTEKLVDCLLCDTIPIYYGCAGIGELFDMRGMLRFTTLEELDAILARADRDLYEIMLPFAIANKRKAIKMRWHDVPGLAERVAEQLAGREFGQPVPLRLGVRHYALQIVRRLRSTRFGAAVDWLT